MVIRAVILLLATLAFALAPFVTTPFRGYAPGLFPVLIDRPSIQPAGYAFSIWALIYLGLIGHAVFGLILRRGDPDWDRVRMTLAASITIGAFWLAIAAFYPLTATNGIYLMMLLALAAFFQANPQRDPWLLKAPIAIYAGWLTAAAHVSLGVIIAGYGWLTDTESAAAMLALTLAIAVVVQLRRPRAPEYGLTIIWALIAIAWVNWQPNVTVSLLAIGGIVILILTILGARHQFRPAAGSPRTGG
jgi:hypothetical protein